MKSSEIISEVGPEGLIYFYEQTPAGELQMVFPFFMELQNAPHQIPSEE